MRNANHIIVGIYCKTWQTRSNGLHAAYMPPEQRLDSAIQDSHCVVQCISAPDVL